MPVPTDLHVPRLDAPEIVIDARADEAAWGDALVIRDLTTFDPVVGAAPQGRTVVRVLSDEKALYLFFDAEDDQPGRVRASLGRRDTRFGDDFVGLYLDPTARAQRAWLFAVTAAGVQGDGVRVAGDDDDDVSWDGRWRSAARQTDRGYEVEIAIPWRTIQHPVDCDELGLLVFRYQPRTGEKSAWPPLVREVVGVLPQEAVVGGPGALPGSTGLDVTPELTFGWSAEGPASERWGAYGVSPGLTLDYAPDPSLTLLATVNPDFSQVESDQALIDVNRRYALYYEEKRAFFLEDQEWFQTPLSDLVYTRSVVVPRAGARATVQRGGWTFAAMSALDAAPIGSVSEGGGWTEGDLADTNALSSVARVRRSIGDEAYVGLLFSDKTLLGSERANRLAGIDTRVRVSDKVSTEAMALASVTWDEAGRPGAVAPAGALQLHYADRVPFLNVEAELLSPGFRAENGFVTRADSAGFWAEGGTRHETGWDLVSMVQPLPLDLYLYWTTEGELRDFVYEPDVMWRWGNGAFTFLEYQARGERFGGTWLPHQRAEGGAGGVLTRWLELYAFGSTGQGIYFDPADPHLGWRDGVDVQADLSFVTWLSFGLYGSWERFLEPTGEVAYAGVAGRAKVEAFASRTVSARFIVDHSTFADETSGEALLAWERSPGQALFVGGGLDDEAAWQVFAKASWVFTR